MVKVVFKTIFFLRNLCRIIIFQHYIKFLTLLSPLVKIIFLDNSFPVTYCVKFDFKLSLSMLNLGGKFLPNPISKSPTKLLPFTHFISWWHMYQETSHTEIDSYYICRRGKHGSEAKTKYLISEYKRQTVSTLRKYSLLTMKISWTFFLKGSKRKIRAYNTV